jgi:hypothetical protein
MCIPILTLSILGIDIQICGTFDTRVSSGYLWMVLEHASTGVREYLGSHNCEVCNVSDTCGIRAVYMSNDTEQQIEQ